MPKYIFNEVNHVKKLADGSEPIGISEIGATSRLMAIKFRDELFDSLDISVEDVLSMESSQRKEYSESITNQLLSFYKKTVVGFSPLQWEGFFGRLSSTILISLTAKLREIEYIPITRKEYELVSSLSNKNERNLLITLICIAKYYSATSPSTVEIPFKINEIFTLCASTTVSKKNQLLAVRGLVDSGSVVMNDRLNKTTRRIELSLSLPCLESDATEEVFKVYEISSMCTKVTQMIKYISSNGRYKQCLNCGKLIDLSGRKNTCSIKYCDLCRKVIKKIQNIDLYKKRKEGI